MIGQLPRAAAWTTCNDSLLWLMCTSDNRDVSMFFMCLLAILLFSFGKRLSQTRPILLAGLSVCVGVLPHPRLGSCGMFTECGCFLSAWDLPADFLKGALLRETFHFDDALFTRPYYLCFCLLSTKFLPTAKSKRHTHVFLEHLWALIFTFRSVI